MLKNLKIFFLCTAFFFLWCPISYTGQADDKDGMVKKILLTGAAGFIGSNFLKYMFDKYASYEFYVLDNLTYAGSLDNIPDYIKSSARFKFYHGSVTDRQLVDFLMDTAHFVVHFAAESHVTRSISHASIFLQTDIMGTFVLLDSLLSHKNIERFIHISTSEVYGTAETVPMNEEHPLNPRSPYAAAKAGADRLVYSYQCTFDIPTVIVRPFNNYGPQQHLEKMIPRFITNAINREPLIIHGDGEQLRDWVHVVDTCRALDMILHHHNFSAIKNEVINIGSGTGTAVKEIAQSILDAFNLPHHLMVLSADRPGQVLQHIASIEKAHKLLNWEPTITLKDGLLSVIEWYKKNHEWWKKREFTKQVPILLDGTISLL